PEPAVFCANHARQGSVGSGGLTDTVIVGKKREFTKVRKRLLQLKPAPDQTIAAGAIDNVFGADQGPSHIKGDSPGDDFKRFNCGLLAHVAPGFGRVVQKNLVKFGPENLIRSGTFRV